MARLYTLKPNSIPNEYYCGDLPGTIQYRKDPVSLRRMVTDMPMTDSDVEWIHTVTNSENSRRLLPHTKDLAEWTLVYAMEREKPEETWLKGAFRNKQTGEIALMTSCSTKAGIEQGGKHRATASHEKGWFIGRYRMGAPIVFWKSLQITLELIDAV